MILNVIDFRKHPYRWRRIRANVEPTWHDNSCRDSDHAEPTPGEWEFDRRDDLSLSEASGWAQSLPYAVTLFLYDLDIVPERSE